MNVHHRPFLVEIRWKDYALLGLSEKQRDEFEYAVDEAIFGRDCAASIIRKTLIAAWDFRERLSLSNIKWLNQYNLGVVITILTMRNYAHFEDLIANSNEVFDEFYKKK